MFKRSEQTGRPQLSEAQERHIKLKALIETDMYQALVDEAIEAIQERQPAVPDSIPSLISHTLGSIVRDVLIEFFERVERKAKNAPDPADYDI